MLLLNATCFQTHYQYYKTNWYFGNFLHNAVSAQAHMILRHGLGWTHSNPNISFDKRDQHAFPILCNAINNALKFVVMLNRTW